MPAGSAEPSDARSAMTAVGSRVTLAVLIARKSAIASVAVPGCGLSRSSSCIARMPNGVAALPRPSALAARFITIAPIAGCSAGTSRNRRVISGRIARARNTSRPPASATFIRPRNSAITPTSPSASVTASAAEATVAVDSNCIADGASAADRPDSSCQAAVPKATSTMARKIAFKPRARAIPVPWLCARRVPRHCP